MRKTLIASLIAAALLAGSIGFIEPPEASAQISAPTPAVPIRPCKSQRGNVRSHCPKVEGTSYVCAPNYDAWVADPTQNFWIDDPEVTALGKGGERSRQFLYWVLTHPSIDDHPVILELWSLSRNIAYFLLLIIAIVMGIGIIVGQRGNFSLKVEVTPLITKLLVLLLYVTFSATVVLVIVQVADILMEFFIRTLGVRELFNIFFVPGGQATGNVFTDSETAYQNFTGCSNLNINELESLRTGKFLVRFTNMTYYFLGIMLILRKIVLWFLLIVAPFLAILAPFIFIRNVGWIWIGVFFQWVFYGPLFALFLGALASIWNSSTHIPWLFDFSRVAQMQADAGKIIYPTMTNILYGGPAQQLQLWNTSSYVDTFAEYVIALIMLWTVIVLPWWLLRIFRDYCCEGIIAAKNVLVAMYEQMKLGPPGGPGAAPVAPTPTSTAGIAMKLPRQREQPVRVKIETVEEIKRAETEEIHRSMYVSAKHLTDIAHFETHKETRETAIRNITNLQNPMRAETPTERQRYMTIRTELYERAQRGDRQAQATINVLSTTPAVQQVQRERLQAALPRAVPVVRTTSIKVGLDEQKTTHIVQSVFNTMSANDTIVNEVSQQANVSTQQVKQVLQQMSATENIDVSAPEVVEHVARATGVDRERVRQVIRQTAVAVKAHKDEVEKIAAQEGVRADVVEKVVDQHLPAVAAPEEHVEDQVTIPPTVSIEDYEEVKRMWADQYERGEVPISETIRDRAEWIRQDVVSVTNILSKLLSADDKLRAEGLADVGYILPIFMINNLKGEELAVYLKAKLEAAKQVAREMEVEAKARAEVTEKEELVEVARPKEKERAKTMKMKREMKLDEGKKTFEPKITNPGETIPSTDQADNVRDQKVEEIKKRLSER